MVRVTRWPCVAMALLGNVSCGQQQTGPDGNAGDTAQSMDATVDAVPEVAVPYQHGTLAVAQLVTLPIALELAAFVNVPPGSTISVSDEMHGSCRVTQAINSMPDAGTSPAASAGVITFADMTGQPVTLMPSADNSYNGTGQLATRWTGGDMITVSAAGGAVPPFQAMITFPAQIVVTSPPNGNSITITRTAGLPVQWMATGSGTAAVYIRQDEGGGGFTQILCSYPFSEGSDMVPSSVLSTLNAGTATVVIGSLTTNTFSVGAYTVDMLAAAATVALNMATVRLRHVEAFSKKYGIHHVPAGGQGETHVGR